MEAWHISYLLAVDVVHGTQEPKANIKTIK